MDIIIRRQSSFAKVPCLESCGCQFFWLWHRQIGGDWGKIQGMIDIVKQIQFLRMGSEEDFAVASDLIGRERIRHGLFFLHLSLEKAVKALVCSATGDLAPRMHNLVRLAELTKIQLSQEQFDTLAEMNAFNIEGRYPEMSLPSPTPTEARNYLIQAEGILKWLNSRW